MAVWRASRLHPGCALGRGIRSSEPNSTSPERLGSRHPVVHLEAAEDRFDVPSHGVRADPEPFSDLAVTQSVEQVSGHRILPRGERERLDAASVDDLDPHGGPGNARGRNSDRAGRRCQDLLLGVRTRRDHVGGIWVADEGRETKALKECGQFSGDKFGCGVLSRSWHSARKFGAMLTGDHRAFGPSPGWRCAAVTRGADCWVCAFQ